MNSDNRNPGEPIENLAIGKMSRSMAHTLLPSWMLVSLSYLEFMQEKSIQSASSGRLSEYILGVVSYMRS